MHANMHTCTCICATYTSTWTLASCTTLEHPLEVSTKKSRPLACSVRAHYSVSHSVAHFCTLYCFLFYYNRDRFTFSNLAYIRRATLVPYSEPHIFGESEQLKDVAPPPRFAKYSVSHSSTRRRLRKAQASCGYL
jgi:hypothetical protein